MSSVVAGKLMHPAQIQAALAMAGYSQAKLARELRLAPTTVSAVVKGRGHSAQVEQRIAEITGYTLAELWPAWHGAPALVLTDEERALVEAYRDLSARDRAEWRSRLMPQPSTAITQQGAHSRAAGRDYHESHVVHDKPDDDKG